MSPTVAREAVITDTDRIDGDTAALERAFDHIRREYQHLTQKHWPMGRGAVFRVVLTVEGPGGD